MVAQTDIPTVLIIVSIEYEKDGKPLAGGLLTTPSSTVFLLTTIRINYETRARPNTPTTIPFTHLLTYYIFVARLFSGRFFFFPNYG